MENTISLKIPTSWEDITVSQYDELSSLNFDTKIIYQLLNFSQLSLLKGEISEESFDNLIVVLSILLDIDSEIIKTFSVSSFLLILSKLTWLKPLEFKKTDDKFNKTQVGLFVDLESIIDAGLQTNFVRFLNKLTGEDVSDQPIPKYFNMFYTYLNWRKKLYEDFSGLFEDKDSEEDIDMKNSSDITRDRFNKKWNWFGFIYTLAGGDILKMEPVTELNMIGALNFLSYEKEKSFLK